MTDRYVWRVYCIGPPGRYETVISETEPTTCPSGGPIDPNETIILQSLFMDLTTPGYINIESQLADNQAIKIIASNVNGGIDIDAGFGGITLDTTNSISLDAAAASNFTTTVGNLDLIATTGLVNINSGSGINLGNNATPVVNVVSGTSGFNVDTTGQISLDSTGNVNNWTLTSTGNNQDLTIALLGATLSRIVLLSQGTGDDSIRITSLGGIDTDVSGPINFASSSSSGGAITLDTGFGGGGINLSAGSQGIAINSTSSIIGIGHWSGTDILIGTAVIARTISIGNAVAGTRIFNRYGTAGFISHQENPPELLDSDATLTTAQLLLQILIITPTSTRTLTLPDVSDVGSTIPGIQFNDSFDFSIINLSSTSSLTVVPAGSNSLTGSNTVLPTITGKFRLRYLATSYIVYRIS